MLDLALQFLTGALTTYFHTQTGSDTVLVKMSHLVDDAGKYAITPDTVAAAIINIEEERTLKEHLPEYRYVNGQHVRLEPELKLNLHIMFAAHFKVYEEALKYLSLVLTFFQAHPSFTPTTYPSLNPGIEKLVMELQSLSFEQINQIWAFIGGKHLPSVIYKVRLVAIQEQVQTAVQPPLTIIKTSLGHP